MPTEQLSGKAKAAIFLLSLPEEYSAEVLKHISSEFVEDLSIQIASTPTVTPEQRDAVFQELHEMILGEEYLGRGGIEHAKEMLTRAFGELKARQIIKRLTHRMQKRPFASARKADPSQIYTFVAGEHPQVVALLMCYLKPEQASFILEQLPLEQQIEIATRIAQIDKASPDLIVHLERYLDKRLEGLSTSQLTAAGGVDTVVEILNNVSRGTEKGVIEKLAEQNADLAEEIRKRMFVFEDIVRISDTDMQKILRDVNQEDLVLSLKAVGDDVKRKVYKNVSKGRRQQIEEELEFLGPVRLRSVEEAQEKIVAHIRMLEEQGEIVIARDGDGDQLVH